MLSDLIGFSSFQFAVLLLDLQFFNPAFQCPSNEVPYDLPHFRKVEVGISCEGDQIIYVNVLYLLFKNNKGCINYYFHHLFLYTKANISLYCKRKSK